MIGQIWTTSPSVLILDKLNIFFSIYVTRYNQKQCYSSCGRFRMSLHRLIPDLHYLSQALQHCVICNMFVSLNLLIDIDWPLAGCYEANSLIRKQLSHSKNGYIEHFFLSSKLQWFIFMGKYTFQIHICLCCLQ